MIMNVAPVSSPNPVFPNYRPQFFLSNHNDIDLFFHYLIYKGIYIIVNYCVLAV